MTEREDIDWYPEELFAARFAADSLEVSSDADDFDPDSLTEPCMSYTRDDRVAALRAENERLREALKPFAGAAYFFDADGNDFERDYEDDYTLGAQDEEDVMNSLTVGHLRQAASVLSISPDGGRTDQEGYQRGVQNGREAGITIGRHQAQAVIAAAIGLARSEEGTASILDGRDPAAFDPWPEMDALLTALDQARPGWRTQTRMEEGQMPVTSDQLADIICISIADAMGQEGEGDE